MSIARTKSIASALVLLFVTTGCFHQRLEKNAPGHIDVYQPPEQMVQPISEPPARDPGENLLSFSLEPHLTGGYGRSIGSSGPTGGGLFQFHLEAAVEFRSFDERIGQRNFLFPGVVGLYPPAEQHYGLRAGWMAPLRDVTPAGGHTFYFEANWGSPLPEKLYLRPGLGWAFEPGTGAQGPQLSIGFFHAFVVRSTYKFGGDWSIVGGMTIPLTYSLSWSR